MIINSKFELKGVYTALVTPFSQTGEFDEKRFVAQVDIQVHSCVTGLVPTGTTGEASTLSMDEQIRVIELCCKHAAQKPVIAGAGSNNTREAIELTKGAIAAGASATLQVAPYYVKPTQDGIYEHMRAVASEGGGPIILYNHPGRTGVDMVPDTVAHLARNCPNIIGIKEASGKTERVTEIRALTPRNFAILCGDDAHIIPFIALGAKGVISVLSNVYPDHVASMTQAALGDRYGEARQFADRTHSLLKLLFDEGNPVGVKALMALFNMDSGAVRLPLVGASVELIVALKHWLRTNN